MGWNTLIKSEKADFKLSFYDSVNLINETHWNKVVEDKNIYLSLDYLRSLEQSLNDTIQFRYVQFYCENYHPVGVAVVQILNFIDKNKKYNDALCIVGNKIKHKLIGALDIKVMVCGNVFACGENGFMFADGVDNGKAFQNLTKALYRLRRSERINGQVSIMLLKEFWPNPINHFDVLKKDDYRDFMIDVNMVLKIHDSWNTMSDYLDCMKAKFRTKANSAFKKSINVRSESFGVGQIEKYKGEIESLYNSVLDNADFQFGSLNGKAFCRFKQNLGDKFTLTGYFVNDELVGFSTAYHHNIVMDAGYVGINYDYNQDYALYQRILYDYVELAINSKAKELRLGRTAEEIKSTLGAEPTDMKLFIKHRNVVSNKLIKPIIDSIVPSKFELRSPFKAEFVTN